MKKNIFPLLLVFAATQFATGAAFSAGSYDHWALHVFGSYEYQTPYTKIKEPFVSIQEAAKGKENQMHLIHSGVAALYKRLDMIDRAQKNIELEYFILSSKKKDPKSTENGDERSTKFVLNKLIDKAIAGVKVRILVDHSATVFQFDENHVAAIKRQIYRRGGKTANFEVKYYNSGLFQMSQFRSHRKLISIDDQEAITGGRNIEDKYFDLDHSYNFADRDIWIKGPLVPVMRASFDQFWGAGLTERADVSDLLSEQPQEDELTVTKFLKLSEDDQKLYEQVMNVGELAFDETQTHICPKATFASDKPLNSRFARLNPSYKEDYRILERVIGAYAKSLKAGDEFYVDSPYVMLNTRSGDLLKTLTESKVKIKVFTNSAKSTDAVYAASIFYREVDKYINSGVELIVHSSDPPSTTNFADPAAGKARWGMHVKSHLYGDRAFFVGTYNIDNRSSFYNAEMGVFCEGSATMNAELKNEMLSIRRDIGFKLYSRNKAVDAKGESQHPLGREGNESTFAVEAMKAPTELLQFLF